MLKKNNFLFVNSSDFTLIRFIAFVGQTLTLGITYNLVKVDNSIILASALIAGSLLISNTFTYYLIKKGNKVLSENQIFYFLFFDILQISCLIAINGGYTNPFIFIILAPLAISATYLSLDKILMIVSLALVCFAIIFNTYIELPENIRPILNDNYSLGIMTSLFTSSIFMVFYLYYFSLNYKKTQVAYQLASNQLQNEKELLKVGGLAAAAVHELGTPLNTINLIVNDFEKDKSLSKKYEQDIDTLKEQLERCKEILKELSTNPQSKEISSEINDMSLDVFVQSLAEKHQKNYNRINMEYRSDENSKNITVSITPELNIAMTNIINNALSFATKQIIIISEVFGDYYTIKIKDDGPGFDKKFIANFGKPFYSTRSNNTLNMGLGLFITKQMIENLKGNVEVVNNNGAEVILKWKI
ncbi:ATP-binding protein [Alphaproteobacteria bacterium]|nr:ATP-binding protein [Alphaproteobacteria bacterium]MDB9824481.1 ATP-binding protein [Alphaproteobacteria bacterium]